MAEKKVNIGKDSFKVIATNRKARYEYEIIETYEAGMSLLGSEVKSLRGGKASFKDSYAAVANDGIVLQNLHIAPYDKTGFAGHEPERPRRLLLREREIQRLSSQTREKGLTIVPLRLYFKGKYAKVEIALCRGKRKYDKRAAIMERETKRNIEREFRRPR